MRARDKKRIVKMFLDGLSVAAREYDRLRGLLGAAGDDERDEILETMGDLWWEMTPTERIERGGNEP
jgi:hypothetical protein